MCLFERQRGLGAHWRSCKGHRDACFYAVIRSNHYAAVMFTAPARRHRLDRTATAMVVWVSWLIGSRGSER